MSNITTIIIIIIASKEKELLDKEEAEHYAESLPSSSTLSTSTEPNTTPQQQQQQEQEGENPSLSVTSTTEVPQDSPLPKEAANTDTTNNNNNNNNSTTGSTPTTPKKSKKVAIHQTFSSEFATQTIPGEDQEIVVTPRWDGEDFEETSLKEFIHDYKQLISLSPENSGDVSVVPLSEKPVEMAVNAYYEPYRNEFFSKLTTIA